MPLEPEDAVEWHMADEVPPLEKDSEEMGMLKFGASCRILYTPAGSLSSKDVLGQWQIEIRNQSRGIKQPTSVNQAPQAAAVMTEDCYH